MYWDIGLSNIIRSQVYFQTNRHFFYVHFSNRLPQLICCANLSCTLKEKPHYPLPSNQKMKKLLNTFENKVSDFFETCNALLASIDFDWNGRGSKIVGIILKIL